MLVVIEGVGSYGARLAQRVADAGLLVAEPSAIAGRPTPQGRQDRRRAINALTALLRTIDLGVDTRKALLHSQFKVVAGRRHRSEDSVVRTCRQEAIRLAKRIVDARQA